VDGCTYKPLGRFRIYFLSETKTAINTHDPPFSQKHSSEMAQGHEKPSISERQATRKRLQFLL
jgi:hypothetical protein